MPACPHRLGHYSGYSYSHGTGKTPASVEVYCGRCKAHVPATLDWFERANERGLVENPSVIREIITTRDRTDALTTFGMTNGRPDSWDAALDKWVEKTGPMPPDVQRKLRRRVLAKRKSSPQTSELAA